MASNTSERLVMVDNAINQEWILMNGARELRRDNVLIDVVLIVDGEKLPACHKFVLAASSPYFRAMFSHGMVEQHKREIDIMGVDKESLELVLDYLYTCKIILSDHNVQGLMTTCSLLQIPGLYGKCRDYMIRRLDVTNCIAVYKFAKSLFCPKLEDEAFRIIAKRFSDLCMTEDFLTLDKNELINIISSDDLWVAKEDTVYESVLVWLAYDIKKRGSQISEIFSHVRFSLMDLEYLNSCILEEDSIRSFPNVLTQVEAAKKYLEGSVNEKSIDSENTIKTDSTEERNTPESSDIASSDRKSFPFYYVNIGSMEQAIRIPLNITPRAGMDTKEFLLFTNGRRTFVINPESGSEYYGCVDTEPKDKTPNVSRVGFDPELPLMKNPEAYATADGTVYLFGGLEVEKDPSTKILTKVFTLQCDTLTWAPCLSLPNPRCMAAYGDGCGNLYVFGGKALSHGEVISHVNKYDKVDDTWDEVNPMPVAVYGHGAASMKDKVYIIGGKTSRKELLADLYCMDCENHQWTELRPCGVSRFLHGVVAQPKSGEIYVVGGSSEEGVLNSVEIYNTTANKWCHGESFPGNRCAQFLMYIKDELHVVGGYVTERNTEGRRNA